MDLHEFKASLVYSVSSRTTSATQRTPVSKKGRQKKRKEGGSKERRKEGRRKGRKRSYYLYHPSKSVYRVRP